MMTEEDDAVIFNGETAADFADLVQERDHMFLLRVQNFDAAIASDRGGGEGSGFDTVGDGVVRDAFETLNAFDDDAAIDIDLDERAHFLQEQNGVDDFGLDGGVFDDGGALSEHAGNDDVLCGADTGIGQVNCFAAEAAAASNVTFGAVFDFCAH